MSSEEIPSVPPNTNEFKKVIVDFIRDLLSTFPELKEEIALLYEDSSFENELKYDELHEYCKTIYPERFFDILYKNESIFDNNVSSDEEQEEVNVCFLPNISFKTIWQLEGVSNKTKETIWNYLQLLLFTVVGKMEDGKSFGDTAKLFEAINDDEFKSKLEETIENMHDFFKGDASDEADIKENVFADISNNLPNPEDFHSHISGMLDGKIGQLATEIAEDAAKELNIDESNVNNADDVFKKLLKNPTKIMNLVKNIGSKLDDKIKSGELKESELFDEATDLMKKMKSMPGMGNMEQMLGKMAQGMGGLGGMGGMGGLGGKKGKFNMGAFQNQMQKTMKQTQMRERLAKKQEENATANESKSQVPVSNETFNGKLIHELDDDEILEFISYDKGEKPEKSMISKAPNAKDGKKSKKKAKKKQKK